MSDAPGARSTKPVASGVAALPTLAMVLVVRDEERFLQEHLRYHRAVGVGRVYAYLDRCTDRTPEILAQTPDAVVIRRDRRNDERYMSTYQCHCLGDALQRARADGVDWLLHLDPDEFAHDEGIGRGEGLPGLIRRRATRLRGVIGSRGRSGGGRVDQLVLRTVEAVPTPLRAGGSFRELRWFQDGGAWAREVLDPTDGAVRTLDHWLGASRGKSLLRVAADAEPASAHHWQRAGGGELVTVRAGSHFHYVVTDAAHWRQKYAKFSEFPATWEKGNAVRFPKQAWKEASVRMGEAEAEAYFREHVAADPAELERVAATPAGRFLRRDDTVDRVLRGLSGGRGLEEVGA